MQSKPQFFLMENVARAADSTTFKEALQLFKKAGYGITIKVMNAAYCGVPQLRKRLIVIGSLANQDGFLDEELEARLAKKPMTVRDYFGSKAPLDNYYRHPRSYARRGVFSVDEPSPTIRGVNRPVPKGYPGHVGDTAPVTERLRSLTTHERALIQTFPTHFVWPAGKTDAEQVIGNAVPVKFAEYIANCLAKHIKTQP
jgi:DNA (cytosine-5)-methyltransferase 1